MQRKLERDESNKMIAGVAAGIAEYLNVEVTWIRVLFLLLAVFGLSGVWIYLILWIAVPAKPSVFSNVEADYKVPDYTYPSSPNNKSQFQPVRKQGNGRVIAGIFLVIIGSYFLLDQFVMLPEWFSIGKLWPLIFVAIGLVILFRPERNKIDNNFESSKEKPFEDNDKPEQAPEDQPLA